MLSVRSWSRLARFGPTTPTRARRLADASVDPTEARKRGGLAGSSGHQSTTSNDRLPKRSRSCAMVQRIAALLSIRRSTGFRLTRPLSGQAADRPKSIISAVYPRSPDTEPLAEVSPISEVASVRVFRLLADASSGSPVTARPKVTPQKLLTLGECPELISVGSGSS
jgi:hypothetical protein